MTSPGRAKQSFPLLVVVVVVAVAAIVNCQNYVDECPEENGFYADAVQCDRYYECKGGQITDNLCPDGLVFDETSTAFAKCSFPFSISCEDRQELQKPKPSEKCPRQNGYFAHEDPKVCDQFYFCVNGVENKIVCPDSLIFDPKTGQCGYSDQVERLGCSSEAFFKFSCPQGRETRHAHPRYPDPSDCQYFYLCINGKDARRNGCQEGMVFNAETSSCDRQANLDPGDPCRNWYNDTTLDSSGAFLPGGVMASKASGTGIPLETTNRKRVSVVRRQRPRPQAQPVPVRQRVRTPPKPVVAAAAAFGGQADETGVPAPPQFSISDGEAIQRFRERNKLVPQGQPLPSSGSGRLTVISAAGFRQRPASVQTSTSQPVDEGSLGLGVGQGGLGPSPKNRFQSRRPPFRQRDPRPGTTGRGRGRPQLAVESQFEQESTGEGGQLESFFANFEPTRHR